MPQTPLPHATDGASQNGTASAAVDLTEQVLGYLYSAALRAAARIGVADHLADGPRTAEQLAGPTGTSAPLLHRTLRLLATRGIFREDEAGAFHLTPTADLLRTDAPSSMRQAVLMLSDETFWLPAGRLEETVRAGHTVFDEIFGAPFFDHLARTPGAGQAFDVGMAAYSESENDAVAAAYPFPATGTVVDVGGGRGGLLRRVLRRNPDLHGVLYDQEEVLRHHVLDEPELKGRWRTEAGDFFTSVPTADVYLVKRVLHDWTDPECLRILRACRAAMADGGRVLAIDAVVPPGNEPHPGKTLDALMMTSLNGRERDEQDFRRLLTAASLTAARFWPTPSPMTIVEATAH